MSSIFRDEEDPFKGDENDEIFGAKQQQPQQQQQDKRQPQQHHFHRYGSNGGSGSDIGRGGSSQSSNDDHSDVVSDTGSLLSSSSSSVFAAAAAGGSSAPAGEVAVNADLFRSDEGHSQITPVKLPRAWRFWAEQPPEQFRPGAHHHHRPAGQHGSTDMSKMFTENMRSRVKVLFHFSTVQGFWKCYNSKIKEFHDLHPKHFFHLMRMVDDKHIEPIYEDPENKNGGEWIFRVPSTKADAVWRDLLLAVIGEQFADVLTEGDDICGVSISKRQVDYVYQVWTKGDRNDKLFDRVKQVLCESEKPACAVADIVTPFFRSHKPQTK